MQRLSLDWLVGRLGGGLPPSWRVKAKESAARGNRAADAVIDIAAPDGSRGRFRVEMKQRLTAAAAADLARRQSHEVASAAGLLVFTRFLSRLARDRLVQAGISYVDTTGNMWIRLDRPAVMIATTGADKDPEPPRRGVRSLKGPKAARLVRALCDRRPPVGVRELARRAETDASYATRVLQLLQDEDIVVRTERGDVADVRWQDLVRRWTQDYSVQGSHTAVRYLAPRGVPDLLKRLGSLNLRYAVTGSGAVPAEAQVAPSALLTCYVDDPDVAAETLDLRPVDAGANVLLVAPFDPVVYARSRRVDGIEAVALSQCLADLLTGTGREPAQGGVLLAWMAEQENAWRA